MKKWNAHISTLNFKKIKTFIIYANTKEDAEEIAFSKIKNKKNWGLDFIELVRK